ncbi:MAG: histidinol dehydrogenase, partial [Armatimonadaceae bacterium]
MREDTNLRDAVVAICDAVREGGDGSVLEYTRRWDFPDARTLEVPSTAIEAAVERVRAIGLWDALQEASVRIERFHAQHRRTTWIDSTVPGEILGQRLLPLESVGVYVPGGRAAYPSTVLMAGIPARVAGVGRRILATPPTEETGLPPDATLAAARIAGFDQVFAMGGAQAVAAMAYGTETVPAVDKIVGPGNAYVNAAKRHVFGVVGIDMLAGPSEVGIVGDNHADPGGIAAEWICQTEHDPDNRALVVVFSESA